MVALVWWLWYGGYGTNAVIERIVGRSRVAVNNMMQRDRPRTGRHGTHQTCHAQADRVTIRQATHRLTG